MSMISHHVSAGLLANGEEHPSGLRLVGDDSSLEQDAQVDLDVNGAEQEVSTEAANRPRRVAPKIHEAIDDPHRLARSVLTRNTRRGRKILHYRGDFCIYDGTAYRTAPNFRTVDLVKAVKSALNQGAAAESAARERRNADLGSSGQSCQPTPPVKAPKVTRGLMGDVIQALISLVAVDSELDAPFWLDRRHSDPDPTNIVAVANGLLNLGGQRPVLMAHSARFFSTSTLPYSYDPDASWPEGWLRFLDDQWADDPESIDCLHEVMGYLLTGETRLHKMFLLIGPPRSGKSTILNVITALIGKRNVASCSANSLGGEFGLQPLLDKTLAILADARMGSALPAMLDRLMRITGGDAVEVNRKNQLILDDVHLKTRFIIVSNELPEIRDASKAVINRYLLLRTKNSLQPKQQDLDLSSSLAAELPGILNLAIAGRARLQARGGFLQPSSGADLLAAAQDLASPVAQFVKECCILDPHGSVEKAAAFDAWHEWADKNGHKVGNSATFGKDLRAAFPGLKDSRPRIGGSQKSCYEGLRLGRG